ncbi:MAG: hypothetical protein MK161_16415 [Pirellulales bacterium]|nr:hypothetical protein [Pirellulales bacterium]
MIDSTDWLGRVPKNQPVHFGEILATLYRNLRLDSSALMVPDQYERSPYIVDKHVALPEI